MGGIFWGLLCIIAPNKHSKNVVLFRATILIFGGFLALFGSKHPAVGLPGSGALAVLVMAFVAGVGWRKYSKWDQDNYVSEILGESWLIFQPILVKFCTDYQFHTLPKFFCIGYQFQSRFWQRCGCEPGYRAYNTWEKVPHTMQGNRRGILLVQPAWEYQELLGLLLTW